MGGTYLESKACEVKSKILTIKKDYLNQIGKKNI